MRFDCTLVEVIVDEDLIKLELLVVIELLVDKMEDGVLFGWLDCGGNAVSCEIFMDRQLFDMKVGEKYGSVT